MSFSDLPDDILSEIRSYLTEKDVNKLCRINKFFHNYICRRGSRLSLTMTDPDDYITMLNNTNRLYRHDLTLQSLIIDCRNLSIHDYIPVALPEKVTIKNVLKILPKYQAKTTVLSIQNDMEYPCEVDWSKFSLLRSLTESYGRFFLPPINVLNKIDGNVRYIQNNIIEISHWI